MGGVVLAGCGDDDDAAGAAIADAATRCKGSEGAGYVSAIADALDIKNTDLDDRWDSTFVVGEDGAITLTSEPSGAPALYTLGAASCLMSAMGFSRIDAARVRDAYTTDRDDGEVTNGDVSVSWQKVPSLIEIRIAPAD